MPLRPSAIPTWGGLLLVPVDLALHAIAGNRQPPPDAEDTAALEGGHVETMVFGALAFLCGWAMERASRW